MYTNLCNKNLEKTCRDFLVGTCRRKLVSHTYEQCGEELVSKSKENIVSTPYKNKQKSSHFWYPKENVKVSISTETVLFKQCANTVCVFLKIP